MLNETAEANQKMLTPINSKSQKEFRGLSILYVCQILKDVLKRSSSRSFSNFHFTQRLSHTRQIHTFISPNPT